LEHSHVFLAADHERSERKTWGVIALCGAMMFAEIIGGLLFGSIALVADGLHMSTHAGALLLAAVAYSYSRRHAHDARFTFGTGKLGDLAGFSSAIVLAMIAVLIGYASIARIFHPVSIHFAEAIPIACLGLAVNIASAWLLSSGGHDHHHGHGHGIGADHGAEEQVISMSNGDWAITIHEEGVPPRFRISSRSGADVSTQTATIETVRPDGARQRFSLHSVGDYLESGDTIPEPHAFTAWVRIGKAPAQRTDFHEHHESHAGAHRDNNMRAAIVHVAADAVVSVLVITGLLLARGFGWLWMDPLAGIAGAIVIASWSYGLVRDTGAILLDMNPDRELAAKLRATVEHEGDRLTDLHLWRLGPGHLGAILCVATNRERPADYYREQLRRFKVLSHVTVEVAADKSVAV
jgi:cation diffusion facilitator family transporter